MDITILGFDPAEPEYVGPSDRVADELAPGIYRTDNRTVAVVVTEAESFLIPIIHAGANQPDKTPIANGREFDAMVTIEIIERLAARALAVLRDVDISTDEAVSHAKTLLDALIPIGSARTATEVKAQGESDAISTLATKTIATLIERTFDGVDIHFANAYSRLDGRYHL